MIMEIIDESNNRTYEVYKIDTLEEDDGSVYYWCWSVHDNKFLWITHKDKIKKVDNH